MARSRINGVIGTRLPPAIIEFIEYEVKIGQYTSVADWVRDACREFYDRRRISIPPQAATAADDREDEPQ